MMGARPTLCTRKVMVKKASIAGSLDQLEFRVKSTCEMLGLDECSGDDKGQVVVATT